jgi:hypothetical protein
MCKTCKSCFIEGTLVEKGQSMILIENHPNSVKNDVSDILALNIDNIVIQVTGDHKVNTSTGWKLSEELVVDDLILDKYNNTHMVKSILSFSAISKNYKVYNIKNNGDTIYISPLKLQFQGCI